jgi:hypothetical protein
MTSNKYTSRKNRRGQIDIIRTVEAHLTHVRVTWYPGWGLTNSGVCAILPGETAQQSADRAFPESRSDKKRILFDPEWI